MAIAVSGGVDSLALAYLMVAHSRTLRDPPGLLGIHVKIDVEGETAGLEAETLEWCGDLGLELRQVPPRFDVTDEAPLDCFGCAKVRRRTLLEAANGAGCSHLALGHHADDVVETYLMSLFYTGRAEAMVPVRPYFAEAITVVRPLYEMQKRELVRLGGLAGMPATREFCARAGDSRRDLVIAALRVLGRDERKVRRQIFWAAVRQLESKNGADAEAERLSDER